MTATLDNSVNLVLASGQLYRERSCPCGAPWPHYPPRESGSQRKERGMGEREESVTRSAVSGRPCRRHLGHWHRALSSGHQSPVRGGVSGWVTHVATGICHERVKTGAARARHTLATSCQVPDILSWAHCLTQTRVKDSLLVTLLIFIYNSSIDTFAFFKTPTLVTFFLSI